MLLPLMPPRCRLRRATTTDPLDQPGVVCGERCKQRVFDTLSLPCMVGEARKLTRWALTNLELWVEGISPARAKLTQVGYRSRPGNRERPLFGCWKEGARVRRLIKVRIRGERSLGIVCKDEDFGLNAQLAGRSREMNPQR